MDPKPTCRPHFTDIVYSSIFYLQQNSQVLSRKWEQFGPLCGPTTWIQIWSKIQNIPSSPLKVPFFINPQLPKPQGTTDPSVTRNKVLLTHGRQSPRSTWVHPLCAVLFSACFALSPHQTALPEALPGAWSQERQPHCRDCWELAVWFSTGSSEHS